MTQILQNNINFNTEVNPSPNPLNNGSGYLMDMKDLPELNYMNHRHDSDDNYVNYKNIILDKSISPYMFNNEIMNGFLLRLQNLVSLTFDEINILHNWKNYIVDKYYYKNAN